MKTPVINPILTVSAIGQTRAGGRQFSFVRGFVQAIWTLVNWLSEGMRLVRAYNELRLMNHRTLQELASREDELDRVLQGYLPRRESARRTTDPRCARPAGRPAGR